MSYRIEIWKHEPDENVLIDVVSPGESLDLRAEVEKWAAARSLSLREPVYVWCMRRDRLMVFHASNDEHYEQARHLIDDIEIFAGMFRIPDDAEIARLVNDPTAEHHLDDYQLKVVQHG